MLAGHGGHFRVHAKCRAHMRKFVGGNADANARGAYNYALVNGAVGNLIGHGRSVVRIVDGFSALAAEVLHGHAFFFQNAHEAVLQQKTTVVRSNRNLHLYGSFSIFYRFEQKESGPKGPDQFHRESKYIRVMIPRMDQIHRRLLLRFRRR